MAVTHPLAVRQGIADFVVDQIDVGSPPGKLVFQTAASAVVATLTFSNPAFGSADGSAICTAAAIASDTNAVGGVVTKAVLQTGAAVQKVLCSVTATGGGGDIQLSNTTIGAGQTVAMTSLTYTAPP